MRVSIHPHDSGYVTWRHVLAAGNSVIVKFNGAPIYECVTADSEAGMIVCLARDYDGKLIWDDNRQALADRVQHGRVEIEIHERKVL